MDTLSAHALETARMNGAQYADIRVVHSKEENFSVKNSIVESLRANETLGFGVRVLVDGAWGFASSREMTAAEVDKVTDLAVKIAKASGLARGENVRLGEPVLSKGTYTTLVQTDPFTISFEDKLNLLMQADASMARVEGVKVRHGHLTFIREHKTFANSEGADTDQTIYEAGGGIDTTAVSNDDVQRRSYPSLRAQGTGGWEYILAMDLPGNAERIATESVQLLTAERCPSDTVTTVILGANNSHFKSMNRAGIPLNWIASSEPKPRLQELPFSLPKNSITFSMALSMSTLPLSQFDRMAWAHSVGTMRACQPVRLPS